MATMLVDRIRRIAKAPSIYVETIVRAPLDQVWQKTQDPAEHEKWDLRFSSITYLPKSTDDEPQRFLYRTRIGFGLDISGEGESVGERLSDGERTSALRFWSDNPISLIRTGSGYWKYSTLPNGSTRFLTGYDYEVRFGIIGKIIDRIVFRPIMGRATAWGFDCLRLWIEQGNEPREARLRFWVDFWARCGLGAAWLYQGIVPKLLFPESGERDILLASGMAPSLADPILMLVGGGQVLVGLCFLLLPHPRRLYILTLVLLAALGIGAFMTTPSLFILPFNPASVSFAMAGLALAGYVASSKENFPWAGRCRRKPKQRKAS